MITCSVDGKVIDFRSFKDSKSEEAKMPWARARLTWSEYSGKQPDGTAKYTDKYADVVVFGAQAEGMVTRYEKLSKNSDVHLVAVGKPTAGDPWKNKEGKYKSNQEVRADNWNMLALVGSSRAATEETSENSSSSDEEDAFA